MFVNNGTQITQMDMVNTDNYKTKKILFNHTYQCHQRSVFVVEFYK